MVKLSTVATISAGQSAPKNNYFSENGIPFIRAGSLEFLINGKGLDYCEKINETNAKICKLKVYHKNAVMFAKSGMSANKGRVYKLLSGMNHFHKERRIHNETVKKFKVNGLGSLRMVRVFSFVYHAL